MARFSWLLVFACAAVVQSLASGPAQLRSLVQKANHDSSKLKSSRAASTEKEALRCFQVAKPVLSKKGAIVDNGDLLAPPPHGLVDSCEVDLMSHQFSNSYGHPFVATYTPPTNCTFSRVVLNLTVTSQGKQFDRLASMYLGDVEIWRTSTAEPIADPGITWTVWKDMTTYLPLWKQNQTLIFDLGNLVNDQYTGAFNAILHASFLDDKIPSITGLPADRILPLSAKRSKQSAPSAFKYPGDKPSVEVTLPKSVNRAVVTIMANGQDREEFWWSNVPDAAVDTFQQSTGPLMGDGSFREVRLRIDGKLAGLAWPFPVVFTGGISPPLHRPIVGPEAFDIREDEIDITPWLGLLCDGKPHTFSMEVVAANDTVVQSYWVLSGKIFVWLNEDGSTTTGDAPISAIDAPEYQSAHNSMPNKYVLYSQHVTRRLKISSKLTISGSKTDRSWQQSFSMNNKGYLDDYGNFQQVKATYAGESRANMDLADYFYNGFSYPIDAAFAVKSPDGQHSLSIAANLTHGFDRTVTGKTVFDTGIAPFSGLLLNMESGYTESTTHDGSAFYFQNRDGYSGGSGGTRQIFQFGATPVSVIYPQIFSDPNPLLYKRHVEARNDVVVADTRYVFRAPYTDQRFQVDEGKANNSTRAQFAPLPAEELGGAKVFVKSGIALRDVSRVKEPTKGSNKPAKRASAGEFVKMSVKDFNKKEFEKDLVVDTVAEVKRLSAGA